MFDRLNRALQGALDPDKVARYSLAGRLFETR